MAEEPEQVLPENRVAASRRIVEPRPEGLNIVMPGAREFIAVVTKFTPPSRKAANSSATAITQSVDPYGVRLYVDLADSGG